MRSDSDGKRRRVRKDAIPTADFEMSKEVAPADPGHRSPDGHLAIGSRVPGRGMCAVDRNWRITYIDQLTAASLGTEPQNLIGQSLWEGVPQLQGTENEMHCRKAMREGNPQQWDAFGAAGDRCLSMQAWPCPDGLFISWQDSTDFRRTEQALRESEARARAIIDHSPAGIMELDYRGPRVVSVNDAMCRISGRSREEILRMRPTALLTERSRQVFEDRIRRRLAGEAIPEATEYEIERTDGSIAHVIVDVASLAGEPLTALIIGHDITERRRTEKALEEASRNFRGLFHNKTVGVSYCKTVFDDRGQAVDFIIVDVNDAYQDMSSVQREEVIGRKVTEALPRFPRDLIDLANRVATTGEGIHFETFEPVSGKWFDMAVYSPHEGYFISIYYDVTSRKLAEEALRRSEERYRSLFESMGEGFCILEKLETAPGEPSDYRYLTVNPAYSRVIGLESPEGRTIRQVYPWIPEERFDTFDAILRTGEPARYESYISATERNIEGYAFRVPAGTRRQIGVLFHDVTERKNAEKMKDEFIGMVSHELKTPLTVVMGALSVATDKRVPQQAHRRLLGDALVHCQILANLVDNLLELSRYESNHLILKAEPTDVRKIAMRVTRDLGARSSVHRLKVGLQAGLPKALVDPIRMERILHNLVDNAIKYSPRGGEVKITGKRDGNEVVIGVSDWGPGISRDDQARLFQSFERLGKHVKGGIQGTGLGLRVCRVLVEAHGGRIWVESEEGHGTTFWFTVPAAVGRIVTP